MAELFSEEWMKAFAEEWNKEPAIVEPLSKINFNSVIGYGFIGEDKPRGVLVVEGGKAVRAGAYNGETLNWDLRAKPEDWQKWLEKGVSMMSLGMAYTTGKLKFLVGDYKSMIKNPSMAGPFIKSFEVMGRVKA
ncbi:MAG: SCP-2 sterol transfer family protein [Gammaproteobacteria bacterium]|nr:MAG: SCP-2 sterol transfer family protein [Gammaproteobacteria bacterium]